VIVFFFAGAASALCLMTVSLAYILSVRSIETAGEVSPATRVLIVLAVMAFLETLFWQFFNS